MSSSFDKFQKRQLISSYFSAVLSIFLLLFLLGTLGLFVINSKKLSNDFKEEIPMTVFFKNEATDTIIKALEEELKTAKFVKTSVYVSKDVAASTHSKDLGEDFVAFLGENPLQNSFDIHLKADYINNDSIAKIEDRLKKNEYISEIGYDKILVNLVNDNIEKVSYWILITSSVLAIIAVLLINSSLRLSIYSHRFTIKTMQMVGATKSFIRMPFIWRSIRLGLIGSLAAIITLVISLFTLDKNYPKLGLLEQPLLIGLVLGAVLIAGVLITGISTFFATQRFLNLRTEDLY
ncbi:MAG: cell division protein FtsX [Flavobacterium sp.]